MLSAKWEFNYVLAILFTKAENWDYLVFEQRFSLVGREWAETLFPWRTHHILQKCV